jgi:aryl-alcohol dehydrogenase-like predicted oxidoreductase
MGFGDATIGQHSWTIGEEPTREIIRRSLDLGVNFFDTAIAYQLGTSEQFVGRALRDVARRDDVVVATKFLPRTEEEIQQISLAWLLTKVESPIVGATKLHHIEGAVKSLDVHLTADDIRYLEEPYVPHNLSGVMAVNKPVMNEEPVWVAASKNR